MRWFGKLFTFAATAAVLSLGVQVGHAGLVAQWNFDNVLTDSTANANNGAFGGAPTPTFSADVPAVIGAGQSLSFGGGSGHVLVPDSSSLDISSAMTISAWVKPVGAIASVGWDGILAKNPSNGSPNNQAGNYELRIENSSRRLTFLHQRGGATDTISYTSTVAIASDAWQHIALSVSAGGTVNFYLNGASAGSFPTNGTFGVTNNNPLYIGSRADLFTTMNGLLDDVRVYNNVLSPTDVFLLANPGIDPGVPYDHINDVLARASSLYTPDGRSPAGAVNGSGLVGRLHAVNPPGGNMWLSASGDVNPTFEMDLRGVYNVDDLRVWNYNEAANATCCLGRGVRLADVYVAGADGVYGASPVISGAELDQAPGTLSDFSQTLSLGGVAARYVKLVVTANHGDGGFTGLSEIQAVGAGVAGKVPLAASIKAVSSNLAGFNRNAAYLLNRTGLDFGDTHSIAPDGTMWLNQGTFPNVDPSLFDTAPEVTFDLGEVQRLGSMKVWNYNEALPGRDDLLGRGVQLANVLVAGDDMNFVPWIDFLELDRAQGLTDVDFSQSVDLTGVIARYVKLQILSNHNGKNFMDPASDDGRDNFAGLGEVQFFAIPEPSSFVLAAMAFCGLAPLVRKRLHG